MNLYVGNLSNTLDEAAVRSIFSKFGTCRVNYFRSFSFVEFEDRREAETAIRGLDGCTLEGKVIKVEWAKCPTTALKCFTCNQDGHTSSDHKMKKSRSRSRSPIRSIRRPSDTEDGKGRLSQPGIGVLSGESGTEHIELDLKSQVLNLEVAKEAADISQGLQIAVEGPSEVASLHPPQSTEQQVLLSSVEVHKAFDEGVKGQDLDTTEDLRNARVLVDKDQFAEVGESQKHPETNVTAGSSIVSDEGLPDSDMITKPDLQVAGNKTEHEVKSDENANDYHGPRQVKGAETEENKSAVASKQKKIVRSRSPRKEAESEVTALDGSKFILLKALKKDPETSRYRCSTCKAKIQKKSIESHTKSKSHNKHI